MITPGQPCVGCGTPIVRYGQKRGQGQRVHAGRGRCRRCYDALRNGRQPIYDFVDDVAVERACNSGVPLPPLNALERREAVRILTGRGWSARAIGGRLGITQRSVVRIRTQLRGAVDAAA